MTHLPSPHPDRSFYPASPAPARRLPASPAPARRLPAAPRDAASAASLLHHLGFVARCDLPDRPGPAYLLVALRPTPSLRHYDPEAVDYWVTRDGRGVRQRLTRDERLPIDTEYSWGVIRLVDRLHVTNEYVSFGGALSVEQVDDMVVARFVSPAPILRRGGHSQGWDEGAEAVGVFFGRFMLAIDYVPGFEAQAAAAGPLARYAAFVADAVERYRGSSRLRAEHPESWALLGGEARRLRAEQPEAWATGIGLVAAMQSVAGGGDPRAGR
jgi:hypothetical protein